MSDRIDFDINNIILEGKGITRKPAIILLNSDINIYKGNIVRIPPEKDKERKIIYSFPSDVKPIKLIVDNEYEVLTYHDTDPEIIYLDESKNITDSKQSAKYYRIINLIDTGNWLIRDYYVENDTLERESRCSSLYPETREGKTTFYYKNGNIKSEGNLKNNRYTGIYRSFYDSGVRESLINYEDKDVKYLQYWDQDGDSLLVNGSGTFHYLSQEGNMILADVDNYSLIQSCEIRSEAGDTIYTIASHQAEYPGGITAFYIFIANALKYPSEARRHDIEGRVYIQFIINKNGTLSEVKTLKGIGGGCDEEAESVIKESKPWHPALNENGDPVKSKMVLPIVFKLG